MKPFVQCRSRAAYLPDMNIDTDAIFPARYLLLLDREGMGDYLFHDRKYRPDGSPNGAFVLNDPDFADAEILIAGDGFGCGSSREQAVWALDGHGIRCVIAPGFGDIFRGNCLKNGILTIRLPAGIVETLGDRATQRAVLTVDLPTRTVSVDGSDYQFDIELDDAEALLNGWDETQRILETDGDRIAAFERQHEQTQPWLFKEKVAP